MNPLARPEYEGQPLDEQHLPPTPLHLINRWVNEAIDREQSEGDLFEPTALYVATATPAGVPSVRTVLMRFLDPNGPGFVTHSTSAKVADLEANPHVSAALVWLPMFRQIRFSGVAEPIDELHIHEYWKTRARDAQLAAVAVRQTEPVASREAMEARFDEVKRTYDGRDVPMPSTFVGYRIRCSSVELWSGRNARMHDRLLYTNPSDLLLNDPGWKVTRLQP